MRSTVAGVLFFLLAAAACSDTNMNEVRLEMEVGYPMLGDVLRQPRIWALCRVPASLLRELAPGETVLVSLECDSGRCIAARVENPASASTGDRRLSGRIVQRRDSSGDAFLLLDPFPVRVANGLYERLKLEPGRTKIIDAVYADTGGRLSFQRMEEVRVEQRAPVAWK